MKFLHSLYKRKDEVQSEAQTAWDGSGHSRELEHPEKTEESKRRKKIIYLKTGGVCLFLGTWVSARSRKGSTLKLQKVVYWQKT